MNKEIQEIVEISSHNGVSTMENKMLKMLMGTEYFKEVEKLAKEAKKELSDFYKKVK